VSRVVVIEYVSVDGVIQGPGHVGEDSAGGFEHGGWTQPLMAEHAHYLTDPFETAGGFLLGRLTYDIWAAYWPTVTGNDRIARALNALPKYVASTTLEHPSWSGTEVIRDVPKGVAELRQQPGNPIIVMGSSQLTHKLNDYALVDEYRLLIHPVVLGVGKKLFADDGRRIDLRLVDATHSAGGLVILTYRPV
jgi:dihydrofolate reductase